MDPKKCVRATRPRFLAFTQTEKSNACEDIIGNRYRDRIRIRFRVILPVRKGEPEQTIPLVECVSSFDPVGASETNVGGIKCKQKSATSPAFVTGA